MMKGSEKQVKWAEDIVNGVFETIAGMKETRRHYDEVDGQRNSNLWDISWEAIEAVEAEYTAALQIPDGTPASVIIDARSNLTPDAIRKHAREWMRHFGTATRK